MAPRAPRQPFNDVVTGFWSFAAPAYDTRFLQRWVYRPAQDELIAALRARRPARVADIACGTGILADRIERELAPEAVYGVDMSDGMLAEARARSSRVRWLTGAAEQLPFGDGELDAVVCSSAFHFFNQPAAVAEFHRVLAPGGMAAVTAMSPRLSDPIHALTGIRWNPARQPTPSEMSALFTDAGFTVADQHRVARPAWTLAVSDLITVGVKP
ncbi:methyltransferase domain-containing protein [[Mycobacterium] kokjensenii]|uniref:Methyltransferase domain-containing protein n=1 Tax=[Mycobacterium] kokjensenii TaxID=3064287 RepID=A0ABM9LWP4_9MYCO|nr:class I SAM-dependent methyltransferase [Mycolicibacter sp. MU0083]CAJ1505997.1 methyltransferase domain-containing protein [Mycolicibacter sp. MU0083]